jgi:3-oxoacyl-(acyl-carrier-protein) synthase
MNRRTVITGIGIVAPNGIGKDAYWDATLKGKSGIRQVTRFDGRSYGLNFAGEVEGFCATDYIDQRLIVQTDRWTWMALAATQMALKDAALDVAREQPYKMSVITASSSGGNEFGQKEIQNLWSKGPVFVGAYQSIAWFYAATTGQIAIKYGAKGPCGVVISECAGGLDALAHARRTIRRGVDIAISGGTEAPLTPYAITCQMQNGCLSRGSDARTAYAPFDARASGYVPGEGGAILLLEELEHARARNAQIYAEVAGHASTHDAYDPSRQSPDPCHYSRAMALALKDAGASPEEVDVIFADGSGTLDLDVLEVCSIRGVFGARASHIPVTAPKSMVGRLYAGSAALDVGTCLLAMRDGVIPPTINFSEPAAGCDLDIVHSEPRQQPVRTALVAQRGWGGFNSAMVLRKYQG